MRHCLPAWLKHMPFTHARAVSWSLPRSVFEADLADHIPVIKTSVAGTRLVGRMTVGNRNGLLLPNTTTDQELMHVRNSLPDEVVVQRIDERLSALGNCIACNDYVALIHPDIDKVGGGGGGVHETTARDGHLQGWDRLQQLWLPGSSSIAPGLAARKLAQQAPWSASLLPRWLPATPPTPLLQLLAVPPSPHLLPLLLPGGCTCRRLRK